MSDTGICPQFWDPKGFTIKPARLDPKESKNMLTGWNESGFRCQLHFPGICGENWAFDEITDPYDLLLAILEFQDRLGFQPSFVFRSAKDLLTRTTKAPAKLSDDNSEFWKPFATKIESEIITVFKPKVRAGLFAHAFDKRMMFLSAARGAMFGRGGFENVGKCRYSELGKAVGLVEVEKLKLKHPIFKTLFGQQTSFYTPYLEFLKDHIDGEIQIKNGWIFRDTYRHLEKFAKTLGDAIKGSRGSDRPEVQAVNSAFKMLYVQLFGWFGRLQNRDGYAAEYYRPDWRGLIIANANTNLLRNILEVEQKRKRLPFAIYHDCLMYFSDFADPYIDFGGTSLLDPNKYTHEWTLPADVVFEAIDQDKNAGQIDTIGKDFEMPELRRAA